MAAMAGSGLLEEMQRSGILVQEIKPKNNEDKLADYELTAMEKAEAKRQRKRNKTRKQNDE